MRRIYMFIFMLLSIFIVTTNSEAASYGEDLVITGSKASVKSNNSSDANTTGTLKRGDIIKYISEYGEWTYVEFSGEVGYVKSSFVKERIHDEYNFKEAAEKVHIKVMAEDYTDYKGDIVAKKGEYVKVHYSDGYGLAGANKLSSQAHINVPEEYTRYVESALKHVSAKKGVAITTATDSTGKVIANVPTNAIVKEYVKLSNGWSLIQYGSVAGYIQSKFISETQPKTQYVNVSHLFVRAFASANGEINAMVPYGTAVKVHSTVAGWAYITVGKTKGYIVANQLTTKASAKPTTKYVNTPHILVRAVPSPSGTIAALIPHGTAVKAQAGLNGWAYVTVGDVKGYVAAGQLSTKGLKPTTKNMGLKGVEVDEKAIKNNIQSTVTIHDDKGKKVLVHRLSVNKYAWGLQSPGDSVIYLQSVITPVGWQIVKNGIIQFPQDRYNRELYTTLYPEPAIKKHAEVSKFVLVQDGYNHYYDVLDGELKMIGYTNHIKYIAKNKYQLLERVTETDEDGSNPWSYWAARTMEYDPKSKQFVNTYSKSLDDATVQKWLKDKAFYLR